MSGYIEKSVEDFFYKINKIEHELSSFSQSMDNKRDIVFKRLDAFKSDSASLTNKLVPSDSKMNAVDEALSDALEAINETIVNWYKKIEADKKGTEFMHKHEKYLVVMIFGGVKAGKSTLGNFFAGQSLVKAKFDNQYKHAEHPVFVVEDSGRNTGGIKTDENGQEWFCEGVTDTTGAIQYFTLSGLRWMDSPGTGALEREGDIKNMEEMVNEYLPYVDMCIFLMNSSEPGLQTDMKYISKLSRDEQEALVVITKSDFMDEDCDDDGNIISVVCPKPEETRKLQEDDICKRIKQNYPEINQEKYRAISVSSYLAKEAVERNSEELFKQSNLDLLMNLLGSKISDEGIAMKQSKPKKKMNTFINDIINGDASCGGIAQLDVELNKILQSVDDYKNSIQRTTESMSSRISAMIRNELQSQAEEWARQVEETKGSISGNELKQRIDDIVNSIVGEALNKKLGDIIEGYQKKNLSRMSMNLNLGNIENKTEKIVHKYTVVSYESRDPDGVFESFCSWFGKEYYSRVTEEKEMVKTIDLGSNVYEWLDETMPQLDEAVKAQVRSFLDDIQQTYFAPQENYVSNMKAKLSGLRIELENLKFRG